MVESKHNIHESHTAAKHASAHKAGEHAKHEGGHKETSHMHTGGHEKHEHADATKRRHEHT